MPEEKALLEDGLKSLKWVQEVKAQLDDIEDTVRLRKQTSELDTIKHLIATGMKLTYRHPSAQ
jgi:hypothetical protein